MVETAALGEARYQRWRLDRRVSSLREAAAFVADVGCALLFPAPRVALPSLWEAVAGPDAEPFAGTRWGDAEQRVWQWKDQLPLDGGAWYGTFVRNRACFLAPDLLAALYPGDGLPDDHRAVGVSPDAARLAEALVPGPQPSYVLRELIGRRYPPALTELRRALLVTGAGVQEQPNGWPAAVFDLTCRRFDVGRRYDPEQAAARFLDTTLVATPAELARTFRWPTAKARATLDSLEAGGQANRDADAYVTATTVDHS